MPSTREMASTVLLWLLIGHFTIRQLYTHAVARESPRSSDVEYLGGRDTIVILWIGYTCLCAMALWHLLQMPLGLAQVVGYAVLFVGTTLRAFSLRAIRGFYFASTVLTAQHFVVRRGPYRWFRHPLYLGLTVELIGLALFAATFYSAALTCLLILEIQRQVRFEQLSLTARIGREFEIFCSATWDVGDLRPVQHATEMWNRVRESTLAKRYTKHRPASV